MAVLVSFPSRVETPASSVTVDLAGLTLLQNQELQAESDITAALQAVKILRAQVDYATAVIAAINKALGN